LRLGHRAVLALGSNLGDREASIRAALADLAAEPGIRVAAVSSLVETPALKPTGVDRTAPAYLNAVAIVETVLDPHALLAVANRIEADHGRVREEHWGDRTLDIDIVDYSARVVADDRLTLPHPHAAQRAFVLAPWFELEPDAVLVGHGPIAELLARTSDEVTPYHPRKTPAPDPRPEGDQP